MSERSPDPSTEALVATVEYALSPRVRGEHHSNCDSRRGKDCDCYARVFNAAFVALDALAARLRQAEEERDAWRHLAARYYSNQWLDRQAAIDRDFRALAASSAGETPGE